MVTPVTDDHKAGLESGPFDAAVGAVRFVTRRVRAAGWQTRQWPNAEHHTLAYATDGRARYICDGRPLDVEPGMLMFFRPDQDRSAEADAEDPWSFYSTGFTLLPASHAAARAFATLPTACRPADTAATLAIFDELTRVWSSAVPGHEILCHSLVLRLLYQCVRAHTDTHRPVPHRRRLEQVVDLLQRRSAESFRVDQLAAIAGLSESRFRVLFKHLTGSSVVQYQNRIRVNKARGLLLSGEHTVTRVAELVGYRDVYYFSRVFKQVTGLSPSTLRNEGP